MFRHGGADLEALAEADKRLRQYIVAELPSEAEQAKSYWDSVYADAASSAMSDPMPLAGDGPLFNKLGSPAWSLDVAAARLIRSLISRHDA